MIAGHVPLRRLCLSLVVRRTRRRLFSGTDVYAFWKEEAQPRLVPPDKAKTGFSLDDYDGEYCYLASAWAGADLGRPVELPLIYAEIL